MINSAQRIAIGNDIVRHHRGGEPAGITGGKMQDSTLYADDLTLLTAVLDHVCIAQHIQDDLHKMTIGRRIILKAQMGERRFQVLADHAVKCELFYQSRTQNKATDILAYRFSMIDPTADPQM